MATGGGAGRDEIGRLKEARLLDEEAARAGVTLLRGGGRSWKALCPFHEERTPSFYIYYDRRPQRFVCYGCHRRGDVIAFLQAGGMSFPQALDHLRGAAPPALRRPAPAPGDEGERPECEELPEEEARLVGAIAEHYARRLRAAPHARAYVFGRGIPPWLARERLVGYADGMTLARAMTARERALAVRLGYLEELRPGPTFPLGLRETLGGRIVVPEVRAGRAIWMCGRQLPPEARDPAAPSAWADAAAGAGRKYLNPPGRKPVLGFERVLGRTEAGVVEGPFDALAAGALGIPAFGLNGTALPAGRLDFLVDVDLVFGLLDPDAAGREAARRFAALLGPRWAPVDFPPGTDLAAFCQREHGYAEVLTLLEEARRRARAAGRAGDPNDVDVRGPVAARAPAAGGRG